MALLLARRGVGLRGCGPICLSLAMREIFSILVLTAVAAAQPAGVTEARYAHLARGVNLNNWFQYGSPLVVTSADVDLLKNAGFTSIRLPVAPQYLLPHWATPSKIEANLAKLDAAIDLFLHAGLAVMLDFQADPDYVAYYWATPDAPQELVTTWHVLAARYSNRNPDLLFFEVMNEPTSAWTQAQWDAEQLEVLAAIHKVAPEHTVLVAPTSWSGMDALLAMTPYADPNVIYVMHDYNPVTFTHQGATWTNRDGIPSLRNVPYPIHREDLQTLIDHATDTTVPPLLEQYQAETWNAERIEWNIQLAAAWAKEWHVRVVVNEFGVYKPYSPPESRARWITDMETALSKYGIGWAMWDYQAGFDLVVGTPGHRAVDPLLTPALGSAAHLDGAAAWPPLTREDLVDLSAHSADLLGDYVRNYKIAFFPGKQDLEFLNDHGVARDITREVKRNFASRVQYRVCQFSGPDGVMSPLTEILNKQFETAKFNWKSSGTLLFSPPVNPLPCGPAGPTRADLNRVPHIGYVLVMGAVNQDQITARLVFVSREEPASNIAAPLAIPNAGPENFPKAAKRIADWSIKQVKDQFR